MSGKSRYCVLEIERALERKNEEGGGFLLDLYNIDSTDVKELRRYNATDFDPENDDHYLELVETGQGWLLDRKETRPARRRSILPGGTREWAIDVIRQSEIDHLRDACRTWDLPGAPMKKVRALTSAESTDILSRRSVVTLLDGFGRWTHEALTGAGKTVTP